VFRMLARTALAGAMAVGAVAAAGAAPAHAVIMPPTPEYVYTYYSSLGGSIIGGYEFGSCGTSSWGSRSDYVSVQVDPGC
jgi:hypothetical protein